MNYGKAEAMLERKWPEKYNAAGHIAWAGRLYFKGFEQLLGFFRGRVYQGTWGAALFQSIYQPASGLLSALPMMPEWYVVVAALAGLSLLGLEWSPLMIAWPLLLAAMIVPFVHAVFCGMRSQFATSPKSHRELIKMQALTAYLHMAQPLVRLWGRIRLGLTPWRRCEVTGVSVPWPWPKTFNLWSETWRSSIDWLESLEANIKALRTVVMRGGDYDRWDLELRGGLLGSVRVLMAVEEHGGGKQLVRFRTWPKCSSAAIMLTLLFAVLSAAAAVGQAWIACGALNMVAFLFMMRIFKECGAAMAAVTTVLRPIEIKKA
jgi:O-antigen biosynthesis protein